MILIEITTRQDNFLATIRYFTSLPSRSANAGINHPVTKPSVQHGGFPKRPFFAERVGGDEVGNDKSEQLSPTPSTPSVICRNFRPA